MNMTCHILDHVCSNEYRAIIVQLVSHQSFSSLFFFYPLFSIIVYDVVVNVRGARFNLALKEESRWAIESIPFSAAGGEIKIKDVFFFNLNSKSYFSFSFEGRNALKEKYIRNVDRVVFFCYGRIEGEEKRRASGGGASSAREWVTIVTLVGAPPLFLCAAQQEDGRIDRARVDS